MARTTIIYGIALAVGAFGLHWLENQYAVSLFSTEIYVVILATLFTFVGIWIGVRLGSRVQDPIFEKNERVIETLRRPYVAM